MIGLSALGVFLLGIGAWMLWRKKSKKVVTWMWLVAGFSLGGGIAATMANVFGAAGGVGGHLFGVGAGVVLGTIAIIMLLELWHGAHPKKGATKTHHPILALVAPLVFGVAFGGVLHEAYVGINNAIGHLSGPLAALIGG